MRAVIRREYGPADVMQVVDVERPTPGPKQLLVRVAAAGMDIGVWHMMTGLPSMARLAIGLRAPGQHGLGSELAGTVEAVGEKVTRFRVGDPVFGVGDGAFAEYAVAGENKLTSLPDGVSMRDAAASAISGVTAVQALALGRLAPGQRVLVLGASGGVGSFLTQIAKARGAHVTAVASAAKLAFVRGLGADEVLDYAASDPTDGSQKYDLVLEMGGRRTLATLRRALTPNGRAVIVGGEGGGRVTGGFLRSMLAGVASLPFRQKVVGLVSVTTVRDLEAIGDLLASGAVKPAIDEVYALGDAPAAMQRLEDRQVSGKVVLDPAL
jgi:NADPH:quinone reductase-like Zn-dependent oxidoreductase